MASRCTDRQTVRLCNGTLVWRLRLLCVSLFGDTAFRYGEARSSQPFPSSSSRDPCPFYLYPCPFTHATTNKALNVLCSISYSRIHSSKSSFLSPVHFVPLRNLMYHVVMQVSSFQGLFEMFFSSPPLFRASLD